jgi:phage FluMu protein Com
MTPPPAAVVPEWTPASAGDCRCLCGSLLARWTEGGVELKCRRCKRTLLVPLPPPEERRALHLAPAGETG